MHEIEVHTCCDGCESDIFIKNPSFDIKILKDNTARLIISNENSQEVTD
jgi:predicted  nucleic acid-binding Zn ribbon protein